MDNLTGYAGSRIQDPGSGEEIIPDLDPGGKKPPDPGSATLLYIMHNNTEYNNVNNNTKKCVKFRGSTEINFVGIAIRFRSKLVSTNDYIIASNRNFDGRNRNSNSKRNRNFDLLW
jgi:hypothetical protein